MKLDIPKGRYIVAVSGGVDSMVLLDLLQKVPDLQLTVAHFEHGIRQDSEEDLQLVRQVATQHGLPFVFNRGWLGPTVSEAAARQARYKFLHTVRQASQAQAIITAHHKDDLLETAILNLLRGTAHKGLSSLKSRDHVIRPLLGFHKAELRDYADQQQLAWREDSTNNDQKYLRNYVRQSILPRFTPDQKVQLYQHIAQSQQLSAELEKLLAVQLHIQPALDKLDRQWFIHLPHAVAREVLATWLRRHKISFDKKTLERLVVAAKTYGHQKQAPIAGGYYLSIEKDYLALIKVDR